MSDFECCNAIFFVTLVFEPSCNVIFVIFVTFFPPQMHFTSKYTLKKHFCNEKIVFSFKIKLKIEENIEWAHKYILVF